MPRTFRAFLRCALPVLVLSLSQPAFAQSAADKARAAELKKQGDDLMDSLKYKEALDKYEAAYNLTKDPALLYNRGRSLEALHDMPRALEMLEQFEKSAPADLKARVPKFNELLEDVRSKVGFLEVRCSTPCPGARVLIHAGNDPSREVGRAPLARTAVNAGTYVVDVVADGYANFSKGDVEILPRGAVLDVSLVRRDTILIVKSDPPSEALSVDGTEGPGTPREINVTPGQHRLLLSRSGYFDVDATVVVPAGERKEVQYSLEKRSVFTRWWFWTLVGVGVTGVVATIVGVSQIEQPPGTGSIPPGQITAP